MRTTTLAPINLALIALLWLASACSGEPPTVNTPDDATAAPTEVAAPAATPETPSEDAKAPDAPAPAPDRDPLLGKKLVSEGALLLDVRTQKEWDERHLEGATLIPVQELDARLEEVSKLTGGDKGKAIVVYCRAGTRAEKAKDMLVGAGYTQVVNLGGIDDWPAD